MTISELENLKSRLDQIEILDHTSAHGLLRDSAIYANKVFGDNSSHVSAIQRIQFRHPSMLFNSGHHMNSDIWNQGVRDLRSALDAMSYETRLLQAPKPASLTTEKITLDWLIKHVPATLWFGAITLLVMAFSFGYAAGK
ncbi:MAG: hypothetical protein HOP03_18070, partial [Lysobacter sp.]|nr:hypothetical protein [Lysobacter sp.]